MSAVELVLGASLGCAVVALILLRRIPRSADGGLPPRPTPAAEVEALREELAAAVEADRGWASKMEAPGYAVRALEAERRRPAVEVQVHDLARLAAERPTLAPEWFSRAMREEEREGRAAIEWDELLWNQDHRLPREKRGAL